MYTFTVGYRTLKRKQEEEDEVVRSRLVDSENKRSLGYDFPDHVTSKVGPALAQMSHVPKE